MQYQELMDRLSAVEGELQLLAEAIRKLSTDTEEAFFLEMHAGQLEHCSKEVQKTQKLLASFRRASPEG
ncbi:hypothetical protein [Balneatrix alpica]|uniref:Uncharacterized protein n=1 Tax=Balneatrix alpica TaxID=75684 RepID=A0ABV5ZD13_9GAMM|nr:hypothetical protein [Balneatrix alpica]